MKPEKITIEQAVTHLKNGGCIYADIPDFQLLTIIFGEKFVFRTMNVYYYLNDDEILFTDFHPPRNPINLSDISQDKTEELPTKRNKEFEKGIVDIITGKSTPEFLRQAKFEIVKEKIIDKIDYALSTDWESDMSNEKREEQKVKEVESAKNWFTNLDSTKWVELCNSLFGTTDFVLTEEKLLQAFRAETTPQQPESVEEAAKRIWEEEPAGHHQIPDNCNAVISAMVKMAKWQSQQNELSGVSNGKWYAENGTVYNKENEDVKVCYVFENRGYMSMNPVHAVKIAEVLNSSPAKDNELVEDINEMIYDIDNSIETVISKTQVSVRLKAILSKHSI